MIFRPASSLLTRCLAAALLAVAAINVPAAASTETEYQYAMTLYKQARWSGAYGRFCELADRGHPEAARIALFMLRYGTELYGSGWTASQVQINDWVFLASRNPVGLVASGGD